MKPSGAHRFLTIMSWLLGSFYGETGAVIYRGDDTTGEAIFLVALVATVLWLLRTADKADKEVNKKMGEEE